MFHTSVVLYDGSRRQGERLTFRAPMPKFYETPIVANELEESSRELFANLLLLLCVFANEPTFKLLALRLYVEVFRAAKVPGGYAHALEDFHWLTAPQLGSQRWQ